MKATILSAILLTMGPLFATAYWQGGQEYPNTPRWLPASCPGRQVSPPDQCGDGNIIKRDICEQKCQCTTRDQAPKFPDEIRCTEWKACSGSEIALKCNCFGVDGSGKCGAPGPKSDASATTQKSMNSEQQAQQKSAFAKSLSAAAYSASVYIESKYSAAKASAASISIESKYREAIASAASIQGNNKSGVSPSTTALPPNTSLPGAPAPTNAYEVFNDWVGAQKTGVA
ncbi:uncharacterized protein AB675_6221 [Cyphellophora attinorum]|uniref:Uncharacterized protein n=1 Tax=Cyphellophora attinorum TaxID=1664694 RepID=A0A0N1H9B9_9EURO|nr:uncharacterized protein AB675_6221 [Phialophora attinorum]KPI44106.1 hypothetical protein AB675_6221 [Phialophora attinorum]